jgi:hypothetical protein
MGSLREFTTIVMLAVATAVAIWFVTHGSWPLL